MRGLYRSSSASKNKRSRSCAAEPFPLSPPASLRLISSVFPECITPWLSMMSARNLAPAKDIRLQMCTLQAIGSRS